MMMVSFRPFAAFLHLARASSTPSSSSLLPGIVSRRQSVASLSVLGFLSTTLPVTTTTTCHASQDPSVQTCQSSPPPSFANHHSSSIRRFLSSGTNSINEGSTTMAEQQQQQQQDTGYLDAKSAAALDEELMSTPGFTLEQLMELAGLSVAEAVYTVVEERRKGGSQDRPKILLVCGPGNNGGDGLVAARHLTMFGYDCAVVYPKRSSRQAHYANLVQQLDDLSIQVLDEMPASWEKSYTCVVDSMFGFSFKGTPREPFATILGDIRQAQEKNGVLVVAVDVPSGWNVDEGDVNNSGFFPDVLVSLTAPKKCAESFVENGGRHFIGGRFLPPALAEKYQVRMPKYPGVAQVMQVSRGGAAATPAATSTSWEEEYAAHLAEKEAKEFAAYAKEKPSEDSWEAQYAAYLAEKERQE